MIRIFVVILLSLAFPTDSLAQSPQGQGVVQGHYLFAWTGDQAKKATIFSPL